MSHGPKHLLCRTEQEQPFLFTAEAPQHEPRGSSTSRAHTGDTAPGLMDQSTGNSEETRFASGALIQSCHWAPDTSPQDTEREGGAGHLSAIRGPEDSRRAPGPVFSACTERIRSMRLKARERLVPCCRALDSMRRPKNYTSF